MGLSNQQLTTALANPRFALDQLDKYESEQSLLNFMKLGWSALEPGVEFVANWGVSAICDHLEAVTSGQIRRLLINVPPGCTKSMTTNVFWPAWEWGPKELPHYRYISFAHERDLATRDNVRCRSLIQSEWFQKHWGHNFTFKADQNAKTYYENSKTGWRQACAAGSLTGRRGDRVIGDDPHSVKGADSDADREDVLRTFSETVPTRLNKQAESAIVVIMQRVHERDVSGLILAKEMGYEHLMLPMEFEGERRCYSIVPPSYVENPQKRVVYYNHDHKTWTEEKPANITVDTEIQERYMADVREEGELIDPIRFPLSSVIELKTALRAHGGTYAEAGQLQQRPAPRGGGMFKRTDFVILETLKGMRGRVVRGWDLAMSAKKKSPYTVGVKMVMTSTGEIIIIDVQRFRKTPGACEAAIKGIAKSDGKVITQDIPQDPGQAGKAQKAAMAKLLHGYKVRFSPETGSKEHRAMPLAAQAEAGNLFLLRGEWNDTFINEAALFPNGEFMDQIDAASRAYAHLLQKPPKKIPHKPEEVAAE